MISLISLELKWKLHVSPISLYNYEQGNKFKHQWYRRTQNSHRYYFWHGAHRCRQIRHPTAECAICYSSGSMPADGRFFSWLFISPLRLHSVDSTWNNTLNSVRPALQQHQYNYINITGFINVVFVAGTLYSTALYHKVRHRNSNESQWRMAAVVPLSKILVFCKNRKQKRLTSIDATI